MSYVCGVFLTLSVVLFCHRQFQISVKHFQSIEHLAMCQFIQGTHKAALVNLQESMKYLKKHLKPSPVESEVLQDHYIELKEDLHAMHPSCHSVKGSSYKIKRQQNPQNVPNFVLLRL